MHYTKTMPDVESLMQEWPPEVEEMLKNVNLPSAELDCDLNEYIDIICCKYIYIDMICCTSSLFAIISFKKILAVNGTCLFRQLHGIWGVETPP